MIGLAPLLLASLAALAPELQVPRNDGWVTDLAGMLSQGQEQELERLMESYKQGSSHEIALLTVPSLEGESLERFGLEVARRWGLGRKGVENGALLLVSQGDRAIRIEVGRGLEGTLTDSISGRIIRDVIRPEFRAGRFAEGLRAGIVAMHQTAGGDYANLPPPSRGRSGGRSILGAIVNLVFLFLLFAILSRRRGRGGFGGIAGPLILGSMLGSRGRGGGGGFSGGGGFGGGGFSGFGGGGGFSGGGASGGW